MVKDRSSFSVGAAKLVGCQSEAARVISVPLPGERLPENEANTKDS